MSRAYDRARPATNEYRDGWDYNFKNKPWEQEEATVPEKTEREVADEIFRQVDKLRPHQFTGLEQATMAELEGLEVGLIELQGLLQQYIQMRKDQ